MGLIMVHVACLLLTLVYADFLQEFSQEFPSNAGDLSAVHQEEKTAIQNQEAERRKKATYAEIGLKGLNEVLKDAKFIFSDGLASVYTKTGGFSQALKDFERVNPTKVKVKSPKDGLEQMSGHFGNKRIILQNDSILQQTKIIVKRQPASFRTESKHDLIGEQIFIYTPYQKFSLF